MKKLHNSPHLSVNHDELEDEHIQRPLAPLLPTINRRFFVGSLATLAMLLPACAHKPPKMNTQPKISPKEIEDMRIRALDESFHSFTEIKAGIDGMDHVAPECVASVLIRWGDKVLPDARPFNVNKQSLKSQMGQFGYNNDHLAFFAFPGDPHNALLCASHEYSNWTMMFPEKPPLQDRVNIEMAAHGGSIVAIEKTGEGWRVKNPGKYNRRIYAFTPMAISGPAAGHERMRTRQSKEGTTCFGTINNCSGGVTPWNTWLMAEENFNFYFKGLPSNPVERQNAKRYGMKEGGSYYPHWSEVDSRFDLEKTPHEANRFGWVVEVDPFDPSSIPVKRTALGRIKHEGAEVFLQKDKSVVVYSGDDQRFEYFYRYVSNGRMGSKDEQANKHLLDDGVLYVAQFQPNGTGRWLPLLYGYGPLTEDNGFHSQAEVLIEARRAADLWGATPLDRPEGVRCPEGSDKVFLVLTNNSKRTATQVDAVNSRANNLWGQIVVLQYPNGDHAERNFSWNIFVQAGDPSVMETQASWGKETSKDGWFSCADNINQAPSGLLTVATDQGRGWAKASGRSDGVFAMIPEGQNAGSSRLFYRVPAGAEATGICNSSLGDSMFVAVQHPGTDGGEDYPPLMKKATFHDPMTRWPDFKQNMPPRPSVVAIHRKNGAPVL